MRQLSEEEINNKTKFYFGRFKEDIVYTGMNIQYFIKFLMDTKYKQDRKIKQFADIQKYKDVVVWGSGVTKKHFLFFL